MSLEIPSWNLEPQIWGAALAAMAAYTVGLYIRKGWRLGQVLSFHGGILTVLVALASPLHEIGERRLFSAHMIQHELLLVVAPPLIVWGLSGLVRRARGASNGREGLRRRAIATGLMLVNVYLWHWPDAYQAALRNVTLHNAEHLLFLGTGLLFWWQIFDAPPEGAARIPWAWSRLVLVFASQLAMMPLGLLLLIAPVPIYPAYVNGGHVAALLTIAGQTKAALLDQQLSAIYMMGGGGAALAGTLLVVLLMLTRRTSVSRRNDERRSHHA